MADVHLKMKPLSQFIPFLNFRASDAFKRELYRMFHRYILRPKYSKMWGFPYVDEEGKVKFGSTQFSKRQKDDIMKCRCGKEISLRNENWYIDEKGCKFHPGKLVYSEDKMTEVFICCHKSSISSGCVRKQHHVNASRVCHENDFVKTTYKKDPYLPQLPNIFALDCEMVYTTKGMEVVKVTVLSVFCDVVYDTFVKPRHPVIDYNTEFSGISESHLNNVTVELKQVQSDLLQLFDTQTILVGHGLENDLLCLNLFHSKVIDTSILFAHSKGFPWRHSLKTLAEAHLNKQIHCSSNGHDSQEDARICIELIARKIFFSHSKEMKKSFTMQSPMTGYPSPSFQNKLPRFPDFRHPPPFPGNWNLPFSGFLPPPCPYPPFIPNQFLSYPLYQRKSKTNIAEQDKKL